MGPDSALPELAGAARSSGALDNIARLVAAAHEGGVQVMHAVAESRPDGRGANRNARLFRAAARLPVQQHTGTTAVRVAAPIQVADEDLVVRRLHGLSPLAGTDVDALLRNLGCRTLVVTGVSANVAIPNAVFDAVNLGYTAVVPTDAIAGCPPSTPRHDPQHSRPGRHHRHHRRHPGPLEGAPQAGRGHAEVTGWAGRGYAKVIESPATEISRVGSGWVAGPPVGLPVAASNVELWQGQVMTLSTTSLTAQP